MAWNVLDIPLVVSGQPLVLWPELDVVLVFSGHGSTTPWTPVAFLRCVCPTEAREKLIDVKLSNILNFPHHCKISKNEQWMKQNENFVRLQSTLTIKSG